VRGQLGLRHERQDSAAVGQPDRGFAGTSASLGGLWNATEDLLVALTVSRSVKIPDPEELYANGPHIATGVFEIGDPDLGEETTLGVDLTLRHRADRVRTELSLFRNRTDDFIFDVFTGELVGGDEGEAGEGEEEEPLPVVRFVQDDAEFWGAEAQVHVDLVRAEPHHLELELSGDLVRAELRRSGEPLPRIPPVRYSAGLRYQGEHLSSSLFARRTAEQDRVAAFETRTAGFTTVDASVGYRFFHGDVVHSLLLAGTNLTDELARNHVSYLKDVAPLPGRDVRLTYRLAF
jgi:iron complex outermembrane receptor protein